MNKCRYMIFILCVFQFLVSGCNEPQTPSEKQGRLIAAENMELQKQLKQQDAAIEALKTQHVKELEEMKKELAKAQDEIETWKQKSQQNVRNQVQDVLDTVLQQNADLRKEIENLKKQLESQQSEISRLEKMLAEKP
jgi:predicted RNase H-like nuclease (RuvC/YqgF family)